MILRTRPSFVPPRSLAGKMLKLPWKTIKLSWNLFPSLKAILGHKVTSRKPFTKLAKLKKSIGVKNLEAFG
jgi:hypothetical protein